MSKENNKVRKTGTRKNFKYNILITGVSSTIGRHLALHLLQDKNIGKIIGTSFYERPHFFNDFPDDKFTYIKLDILRSRDLHSLFGSRQFRNAKINTVVHLAFISKPQLRGKKIHKINVQGTQRLLDKCIEANIKKFIFKSSDVVYKLEHTNPVKLNENSELNFDPAVDQWIKDRVDADMICRAKMDNQHTNIVILRMTNIIGRNINNQLNSYFDGKLVFKTMGFNPIINLLHMKDVIMAIKLAILKNVHGIFNIGGNDTAAISTFAELNGRICVSLPAPMLSTVNFFMRKLGLTDYYYGVDKERMKYSCVLDYSKAKKILGYNPTGRVEFRDR